VLGYDQPIIGYNSDGWYLVESNLTECILEGYESFFVLLLIHLFWLWNCVDFTFWMTVRVAVDAICSVTTNALFWFIEQIIEPNITVEKFFGVLFWFISPPLLLMNLMPVFHNYKNNYQSSILRTPRCCSSGRHNCYASGSKDVMDS
jgi:hypothetical protein